MSILVLIRGEILSLEPTHQNVWCCRKFGAMDVELLAVVPVLGKRVVRSRRMKRARMRISASC